VDLITVVVIAVLLGFLTYILTTQVPMPPTYARAIQVIVLVLLVLWMLSRVLAIPNVLPR
jgi:hypothetical protein